MMNDCHCRAIREIEGRNCLNLDGKRRNDAPSMMMVMGIRFFFWEFWEVKVESGEWRVMS